MEKISVSGVNVLRAEHHELADQSVGRGGLRGLERYRGAKWTGRTSDGAEILDDALAGMDCAAEEMLQLYGHAIVVGRIRPTQVHSDRQPLVYCMAICDKH